MNAFGTVGKAGGELGRLDANADHESTPLDLGSNLKSKSLGIASDQLALQVPYGTSTPIFVVVEEAVRHNLRVTVAACGSPSRFMPHLKTHRSPWITELLVSEGVTRCKVATTAEAELALSSGMDTVLWAYPTVNPAQIKRFIEGACKPVGFVAGWVSFGLTGGR